MHGGGIGARWGELVFDASMKVDVGESNALLQEGEYCLCGELRCAADDNAGHALNRYTADGAVTAFDDDAPALFFCFAAILQ